MSLGKLLRYNCNRWLTVSSGGSSSLNLLDNNFQEVSNGFWQVNFGNGTGITMNESGDVYILEDNSSTIRALKLYGGTPKFFNYMVKDTRLGFGLAEDWASTYYQKTIYLPADRNYSVEIFPDQSMPIYYDLNNASDYAPIGQTKVDIVFNTTSSPIRITGRLNLSNGTGTFDDIFVVNYLLEPGDMVFAGMPMPWNMSSWERKGNSQLSDHYNAAEGTYNITLQGTTMSSNVLMMMVGRIGTNYYASFRNISPKFNTPVDNFNFIFYKFIGVDFENVFMQNKGAQGEEWKRFGIPVQKFTFVNGSGVPQSEALGHLEIDLKYSNIDSQMPDFTWMVGLGKDDMGGGITQGNGKFYLPLLNYSVAKLVMYAQEYEPVKVDFKQNVVGLDQLNITLQQFDVGGIEGGDILNISIGMYKSSTLCDVPYPSAACTLTSTASESEFSPLNAVIGGGEISFRITNENGITVHYKNVDMIASGPPDAMFDSSANESQSGSSLEEAWRFGSSGPDIYDGILIGVPYNESEFDESKTFTISIAKIYDDNDDWALLWDVEVNGTTGLKTNLTDYADFDDTYFTGLTCSKTNSSHTCYVNTTDNLLWLTIPHFSGLGPQVGGAGILGNITSDKTVYSCYPYCTTYVNVTVTNSLLTGEQIIFINNSDLAGTIDYDIWGYNNSMWVDLGNNNTATFFNLSMGDNLFRINISMPSATQTKWNFSIYVNGTYYTLDPYLDSVELSSPANTASSTDTTPTFYYLMHSANWTTQNCILYLNGTSYGTNSTSVNNTNTSITASTISQGYYDWMIGCNITGNSTTRSISIDAAPLTTLQSPTNGTNASTTYTAFVFSVSDSLDTTLNCNTTIDGVVNYTNTSVTGTITNVVTGFSEGTHTWNVTCWDDNVNINWTEIRSFTVDSVAPAVGSDNVNDTSVNVSVPVYFDVGVTDTTGIKNASFYINGVLNSTNTTLGYLQGPSLTYYPTAADVGTINITVLMYDYVGLSTWTDGVNVNVSENMPPLVTLSSPVNGLNTSSSSVAFTFNATDAISTYVNCTLQINGVINQSYVNLAGVNTTTISGFSETTHYYNLTCNDSFNNVNNTILNYQLTVDNTNPTTAPNVTNVSDGDNDGNLNISWTVDSNAAKYGVFRATTNVTTAASATRLTNTTKNYFIDNTSVNGTKYYYLITAIDYAGNENTTIVNVTQGNYSGKSNDQIKPKIPTSIIVTNSSNTATITWARVFNDVNGNPDSTSLTYTIWYLAGTSANFSKNASAANFGIIGTSTTNYTQWSVPSSCGTACNYIFAVTTIDDGGNKNTTLTSYNARNTTLGYSDGTTTTTTSSSSGGGGGGFTSSASNIEIAKVGKVWAKIEKDEDIKWNIDKDELSVNQVLFSLKSERESVGVDVASVSKPSSVTTPKGKTYEYLDITIDNFIDNDISDAKILFYVTSSWLNSNSASKEDIRLLRYHDKEWQTLDTKSIGTSGGKMNFEATVPGFSYFAIIALEEETSASTQSSQDVKHWIPPDQRESNETENATEETTQEDTPTKKKSLAWLWWTIFVLVVAGIAVGIFLTLHHPPEKNEKNEPPKMNTGGNNVSENNKGLTPENFNIGKGGQKPNEKNPFD